MLNKFIPPLLIQEVTKGLLDFEDESSLSKPFCIKGFHEVILSVRDVHKSAQFYEEVAGWEKMATYKSDKKQLSHWGLSPEVSASECLMISPGVGTGHTRLIQFDNVDQRPIRANSQSWDTGGIYDLDVRATDLDATYKELQAAGWSGFNDPISYEFGKFHVSEILMKGPDDVVLAIIERHKPELEGFPHMKKLSHVFNSSQIVSDMEVAKDFYIKKLGFKIYVEHILEGSEEDQNLFGMPHNLYEKIVRKICILHPDGLNAGSVELIQLDGARGNDLSAHAVPPHLGIMGLRFPTQRLTKLRDHLMEQDVPIVCDISTVDIQPYGKCNIMVIRSPDGAWLEFIELANVKN